MCFSRLLTFGEAMETFFVDHIENYSFAYRVKIVRHSKATARNDSNPNLCPWDEIC